MSSSETAPSAWDSGSAVDQIPLSSTHSSNGDGEDVFSRQLLAVMVAFRGGNFSVRMPVDLTGIHGKIADAFNDVLSTSERRVQETARVSRVVGKEGKLKQRMAVHGVSGGW